MFLRDGTSARANGATKGTRFRETQFPELLRKMRPSSTPSKPASGSTRLIMCCKAAAGQSRAPAARADASRHRERRQAAVHRQHAVHQHDSGRRAAADARQTASSSAASRAWSAGTRWRWSCAPTRRTRASAATSRRSPRRPRCTKSASITSSAAAASADDGDIDLLPGPRVARHLRARVPRRPDRRNASRELPPRAGPGGGLSSYPHPWLMPDFWEYPDRVDGPRPDHGDLPGAVHPLPRGPRPQANVQREGLGVPRRRRNRRARNARRDHARLRARSSTT